MISEGHPPAGAGGTLAVEYELNQEDAREFSAWCAEAWPGGKLKARVLLVLGAVALGLFCWFFWRRLVTGRSPGQVVAVLTPLVAVVVVIGLMIARGLRLQEARRRRMNWRVTLVLGEAGVEIKSDRQDGLIAWGEILDVVSRGDHDYLVLGPRQAIVVPARAFATADERRRFADAAREFRRAARAPAKAEGNRR